MSAAIAAFAALVGYIGAEVAEETLFERLLWPQRFYNYLDASSFAKLALLGSMSGPLHRAALFTLDTFRRHGLYGRGMIRGDMLGTAFFPDQKDVVYFNRTAAVQEQRGVAKKVRNGFWVEVLRQVESRRVVRMPRTEEGHRLRAIKPVFRLRIDAVPVGDSCTAGTSNVSESRCTIWTFAGILASELAAILVALGTSLWCHLGDDDLPDQWLVGFFCIPVILKILAALCTVRREGVQGLVVTEGTWSQEKGVPLRSEKTQSDAPGRDILEVQCDFGYVIISTPRSASSQALQFFRHYGHPVRASFTDRAREISSIAIVYAYVLYFPAGLLSLSWMSTSSQYLWLGFQLYCVVAMHITRLAGWHDVGRTEARVAKILLRQKSVNLTGSGGLVQASLDVEDVGSVHEGQSKVGEYIQRELQVVQSLHS